MLLLQSSALEIKIAQSSILYIFSFSRYMKYTSCLLGMAKYIEIYIMSFPIAFEVQFVGPLS